MGYVIPICTFHALAKEVFEHQEVHIRLPNLLLMYCSSQNFANLGVSLSHPQSLERTFPRDSNISLILHNYHPIDFSPTNAGAHMHTHTKYTSSIIH